MIDSDTCQSRIYNILDYHTKMRIQVEKKNSNFRKYATRTYYNEISSSIIKS